MRPTVEELNARFARAFPEALEIHVDDDSARHAGHPGAAGGAGLFRVRIVSPRFADMPTLARHRLVYHPGAVWIPHRDHALRNDARAAPHR